MKKIYLTTALLLMALATIAQQQRWGFEMSMGYVYTTPMGSMANNIKNGHGFVTDFAMITPSRRVALGVEVNFTQYGRDKNRQVYDLGDGTTANMDVIVSNSFANTLLVGRVYLNTTGKVLPYVSAKAGWSEFQTNLNVYDPDDWDHCEPVETEVLHRDGTIVATFGGGVRLDFSRVFKKIDEGILYFDINANFTQGGSIQYMNTDAPAQHNHGSSEDVMLDFINTETQDVHEHHVGHLYNSPITLADFRFSIAYRINR